MKVCFVVLAHHQPAVFSALIRQLSRDGADVVVHVDARANMADFAVAGSPSVHLSTKRNRVNWTGWSQTSTICECLEHGMQVSDADYFIYLAGTDFPIRPARSLLEFLRQQHPANFINYYPLVPGIWGYGLVSRYRFIDLKASIIDIRHPDDPRLSRPRRRLGHLLTRIEDALTAGLPPRNTAWMDLYSGSSRWCLNRETVRTVVESYRSGKARRLRNFLRLNSNSDEIFFQTVVLNSRHRAQCVEFDEAEAREIFDGRRPAMPDEKRVYLHYIDWSPQREDPAILDERDFGRLRDSGKYFACKFTDDRSLGLVRKIECELLQDGPSPAPRSTCTAVGRASSEAGGT